MEYFKLIYLSVFCGIISILSFFNIIYSYYFNLYLNLNTYFYTFSLSLFLTFLFSFKKNKENKKDTIYEKILTLLLGYFLLPLIISIPFYFSIYNLTFVNSYFEAISGFTSTGFTIFENIKHIDQGLILWRSSSQWVGGLYFLFSIILLIDIFDNNFKKSLTNFKSFNKAETLKQSFKILLLYTILTFLFFLILSLLNIRAFNSLNLAMTIISSGGFLPTNSLSSILLNNTQIIIFAILMLASFFSIFLSYNLIFIKNKNINVIIVYNSSILKDCFNVSALLKDLKFVNDFLKLLSKISINKIIENKKYKPPTH